MEFTITEDKERSEELENFKEEITREIKKTEVALKIREEKNRKTE
jgi:hypothetical protein